MLPVVVVVVGVVVVGCLKSLRDVGPTFSLSQPEKLLMEHSSTAPLARRRMEEIRIVELKTVKKMVELPDCGRPKD
ncbi:hypothetical protein AUC43_08610 [Hymenobacter sedentarius]|uniref:Uncharacterized protein n=1 Tax=Hymenobacter sedentarius TaxID=1411621 RepID=A0A0U4AAH5_9BACT|nr:hypothetical protein AUC43_08610 [Hymenobacter sedentarius]